MIEFLAEDINGKNYGETVSQILKNMNGQKIDCLLFIVPLKLFINI